MKKYTKPAVNVVELAVKESLSALPNNVGVTRKKLAVNNLNAIVTAYSNGGGYKPAKG